MQKQILAAVLLLIGANIIGQNLTYEGPFHTVNFDGNAKYTYEDQTQRLYKGAFNFTIEKTISFTGDFKNGMKDGLWNFELKKHLYGDLFSNDKYLITAKTSGKYANGKLTGEWHFTRIIDSVSSKRTGPNLESTANFTDNKFSTSFRYSYGNESVTGSFDSDGMATGIWKATYMRDGVKVERMSTYRQGVLSKIELKDLSNGELIVVANNTDAVDKFFIVFNKAKTENRVVDNAVIQDGKIYKLVPMKISSETLMGRALNLWLKDQGILESNYLHEIKQGSAGEIVNPEQSFSVTDLDKIH